jgi:hypothetical protein
MSSNEPKPEPASSNPRMVSLPGDSATDAKTNVSLPAPPRRRSSSRPPRRVSSPPSPKSRSFPGPPRRVSLPNPPKIRSLPPPPLRSSSPPRPKMKSRSLLGNVPRGNASNASRSPCGYFTRTDGIIAGSTNESSHNRPSICRGELHLERHAPDATKESKCVNTRFALPAGAPSNPAIRKYNSLFRRIKADLCRAPSVFSSLYSQNDEFACKYSNGGCSVRPDPDLSPDQQINVNAGRFRPIITAPSSGSWRPSGRSTPDGGDPEIVDVVAAVPDLAHRLVGGAHGVVETGADHVRLARSGLPRSAASDDEVAVVVVPGQSVAVLDQQRELEAAAGGGVSADERVPADIVQIEVVEGEAGRSVEVQKVNHVDPDVKPADDIARPRARVTIVEEE